MYANSGDISMHYNCDKRENEVSVFGFSIQDDTLEEAVGRIIKKATSGLRTRIYFLNAHCVNVSFTNRLYKRVLGKSDLIYADGSGVRYAAKLKGISLRDNVNGTDLFPLLCQAAAKNRQSIYFLGGQEGVAHKAAMNMKKLFPDLIIAGTHHGFMRRRDDEKEVFRQINESGASIVLVGFGVPKQEIWIDQNHKRMTAPVILGVGGLFDYYSGRIPRAPEIFRKTGFEWLWRLYQEPGRMWRRYILGNIEFIVRSVYLRFFQSRVQY